MPSYTMPDRAFAMIAFPLPVTENLLRKYGYDDTAFNVAFAYDPEEAAGFIARDLDRIIATWPGDQYELDHLRGFVREFRDRPVPPGAPG